MACNRHSFAVLNKNRVVVFIMTLFWGAYGTRHASGMYVRFVVAFLFKHQWWAPCGPQLDCTRVVNIQMMCTVAYLGIPVLLFPGEWTFLRCLDLLWPGFESWLDIDLVVFQRCPKITWGVDSRRVRFRLCVGVHGDGVRDSVLHGAEVWMTMKAPMLLSKVIQFLVFVMLTSCIECTIASFACERHFNVWNDVWRCVSMVSWGVRVTSPPAW